jgi:dTDP-glucose 4,6-dehydratase
MLRVVGGVGQLLLTSWATSATVGRRRPRSTGEEGERVEFDGSRLVVTGGAGFLGSHLCDVLLAAGAEVVCLDNFSTGSDENIAHLLGHPRFRMTVHDVTTYLWGPDHVDAVLHLASPAYLKLPIQTLKVGSLGTHNALGLAKASAHGSSWRRPPRSMATRRSTPSRSPTGDTSTRSALGGVYDEARRFSEARAFAYHRTHGVEIRIPRIFNTYGPRMRMNDGRAVPTFIRQALVGEPLTVHGDGSRTRSLCYVDDLIECLVRLLVSDETGPVNIGSDYELTMTELAEAIVAATGSASTVRHVERPEDDPQVRRPDTTLARFRLGWHAQTKPEEGIVLTVAWYRAAGGSRETGAVPRGASPARSGG